VGEPSGKARRVSRGTVVRRAAFLLFDCPSNQSPPVHAGGFCLLFREQKMKRLCTIRVPRTPASRQQGARHDASPRRQGVAGVRLRGLAPAPVEQGAGRRQGVPPAPSPRGLSDGLRVAVLQFERFKSRLSHSRSNSRGSHRRAPSLENIIELVKVGFRRQLHAVLIAASLLTCISQRSRGV
jgi:hypothetical protein